MTAEDLEKLYAATEQDLHFAIGTLIIDDRSSWPYVHIYSRSWTRTMLDLVRGTFGGGLTLTIHHRPDGRWDLHLATRELMTIQAAEGGHTSVLRAPAWDAELAAVDAGVVHVFHADRNRVGGYVLVLQAREWESLTFVGHCGDRHTPADFADVGSHYRFSLDHAPQKENINRHLHQNIRLYLNSVSCSDRLESSLADVLILAPWGGDGKQGQLLFLASPARSGTFREEDHVHQTGQVCVSVPTCRDRLGFGRLQRGVAG